MTELARSPGSTAGVPRVEVDRDRCAGTGGCEALSPDVFEIDDDGGLVVLRPEPAAADLLDVRRAVAACPTRALRLVADG